MIKINFIEPETEEWNQWKNDCDQESKSLTKNSKIKNLYKKRNIKDNIFFNKDGPFHGKCVYCERLLAMHDDMDHFRPKKGVTDKNNKKIEIIDESGNTIPHPGYYWLAYDWKNLLPACKDCNSLKKVNGKLIGKQNRFPVKGKHASCPEEIKAEKPLLINPVIQDPSEHLKMDTVTGNIIGLTEKGNMCIDIFGLNDRDVLLEGRKKAMYIAKARWNELYKSPKKAISRIKQIKKVQSEYSFAGQTLLEEIYKSKKPDSIELS